MKIKQYALLLFMLFLISVSSTSGQQADDNRVNLSTIIPPSPNAAAIMQYGNVPVSYNTGTYNISIPVYNYKSSNGMFSFPISLNYQTGGVNVDAMTPNTGVNWSLSTGVISRVMVGLPDDHYSQGFIYSPEFSESPTTNSVLATVDSLSMYSNGGLDCEPDIFSFNVNGKQGRFYLGKNKTGGDDGEVIQVEPSGVKIKYFINKANSLLGIDYFTITTEDGVCYTFSDKERTLNHNKILGNLDYCSSWYLSKIEFPFSQGSIIFTYDSYYIEYTARLSDYMSFWVSGKTNAADPSFLPPTDVISISNIVSSKTYCKRLKEILFPDQKKLSFIYSTTSRTDLSGDLSLDSIVNVNRNGLALTYDYSLGGRLTLKKITPFAGTDNSAPYLFEYNDGLPPRLSKSQDFWGYANGKPNASLVPKLEPYENNIFVQRGGTPSELINKTGDRSVDSIFVKSGTLKNIQYPTGGSSRFEYESHTASNSFPVVYYKYKNNLVALSGLEDVNYSEFELFNDYDTGRITFSFNFRNYPFGIDKSYHFQFFIKSLDETQTYASATFTYANTNGATTTLTNHLLPMFKGRYKVLWKTNYPNQIDDPFSFNLQWSEIVPDSTVYKNLTVGGVRIKKITDDDAYGNRTTRLFKYLLEDEQTSSGKILYKPSYSFITRIPINYYFQPDPQVLIVDGFTNSYYNRYDVPMQELSYLQGNYVTYKRVEEIYVTSDNNENTNGRKIYTYNLPDYFGGGGSAFPFPPLINKSWKNNVLDKVLTFNSQGALVNKKMYYYADRIPPNEFWGYKVRQTELSTVDNKAMWRFTINPYLLPSGMSLLDSSYNIDYSDRMDSTVQKMSYTYEQAGDNFNYKHFQPIAIRATDSRGANKIATFSYPTDYASENLPIYIQEMKNKNLLHYPIEQVTYFDNGNTQSIISGKLFTYDNAGNGLKRSTSILETASSIALGAFKFSNRPNGVLPISGDATSYSPDNHYKSVVQVNQYDQYGNILEQQKTNDIKEVYLWGYNSQYPVAKIIGSDFNTVNTKVDTSVLNHGTDSQIQQQFTNLRSAFASSPLVQVWTYTYAPLIGMTSETDPKGYTTYYEYDSFGRLIDAKDKDGNVIKKYNYHYQGQ